MFSKLGTIVMLYTKLYKNHGKATTCSFPYKMLNVHVYHMNA